MARSEERTAVLYSQPGKMDQPVCCSELNCTEPDFTPAGWNSGERGPEVCEQEGRDRGDLHRFIYNIYPAYKRYFLSCGVFKISRRIGLEVKSQMRLGPGLGWLEEDWTGKFAVVPGSCFWFFVKKLSLSEERLTGFLSSKQRRYCDGQDWLITGLLTF